MLPYVTNMMCLLFYKLGETWTVILLTDVFAFALGCKDPCVHVKLSKRCVCGVCVCVCVGVGGGLIIPTCWQMFKFSIHCLIRHL